MIRNNLLLLATVTLMCTAVPAGAATDDLWRGWDDGLAEAGKTGRPVVVDVYTDWCGWCKRMDRDVYARQDVRDYLLANFVPVKINAERNDKASYLGRDMTSRTLSAGFRVSGFPTTIFLRSGGEHVVNVPGYIPPDQFLLILRYIGEGHMDKGVDFREFQKSAAAAPNN